MLRQVVAVAFAVFCLEACGDQDGLSLQSSEDVTYDSPSAVGNDPMFQYYVANRDYDAAIDLTCSKFSLDCQKISFGKTSSLYNNIAETSALTNKVTISEKAFFNLVVNDQPPQKYSERYRTADVRALAIILVHENFHKKQSAPFNKIWRS